MKSTYRPWYGLASLAKGSAIALLLVVALLTGASGAFAAAPPDGSIDVLMAVPGPQNQGLTSLRVTWEYVTSSDGLTPAGFKVGHSLSPELVSRDVPYSASCEVNFNDLNAETSYDVAVIPYYNEISGAVIVQMLQDGKKKTVTGITADARSPDVVPFTPTVGDMQITLTWQTPTTPLQTGGRPILRYEVSVDVGTPQWRPIAANLEEYTITGLENGIEYTIEFKAVNEKDPNGGKVTSRTATPLGVPTAPVDFVGAATDTGTVWLTWKSPDNWGTSNDRSFAISILETATAVPGDDDWDFVGIPTLSGDVYAYEVDANFVLGTNYWFSVRALNDVGPGPRASYGPVRPRTVPSAPRGLQASTGTSGNITSRDVLLEWKASEFENGATIDYYEIRRTGNSGIVTVASVDAILGREDYSYLVTNLTSNTNYTFYVRAHNAAGYSPAATVSATPYNFVAVTDVTLDPAIFVAGGSLTLISPDVVVTPRHATNSAITWTIDEARTTAAGAALTTTATVPTLRATGPGRILLVATIAGGVRPTTGTDPADFVKEFDVVVRAPFEPVTNIQLSQPYIVREVPMPLRGIVEPSTATKKDITWLPLNPVAGTGNNATLKHDEDSNTITLRKAISDDYITVRATIADGLWAAGYLPGVASEDYTQDFDIPVYVRANGLSSTPATRVRAGVALPLQSITVTPADATNKEIVWDIVEGGTGTASVENNVFTATANGNVILRATVTHLIPGGDGEVFAAPYTQTFNILVQDGLIPVTGISGIPSVATAGTPVYFTGAVVEPSNATNKAIVWNWMEASLTNSDSAAASGDIISPDYGPYWNGGVLRIPAGYEGMVTMSATIADGLETGFPYTENFVIRVNSGFVAVTNIIGVPTTAPAGTPLDLNNGIVVEPSNATNKDNSIVWSVYGSDPETGAYIAGGSTLHTAGPGRVDVLATIIDGVAPYSQHFIINITQGYVAVKDITGLNIVATANEPLTLGGTVVPENATNKTITWAVAENTENAIGATVNETGTFLATSAGTVTLTATVKNGLTETTDYTRPVIVTVNEGFVPVTNITGVPTTAVINEPLLLTATITPSIATRNENDIIWTIEERGQTGATINNRTFLAAAKGTATVRATIQNATADGGNVERSFSIRVDEENAHVAVTDITGVPTTATAGTPLTLSGTVVPVDATNDTITWSVSPIDPGTTGAGVVNGILTTTAAGTAVVRATVANGLTATTPYTKDFYITVNAAFEPVTRITGVPTTASIGEVLTLTGTVVPSNATNQTIDWSLVRGAVTLSGSHNEIFTATSSGEVVVRATIVNGLTATTPYIEEFTITVTTAAEDLANELSGLGLNASVNGSTVTVTGSYSNSITANVKSGVTLAWNANLSGSTNGALLTVSGGGTLVVGNGASIVNSVGGAINSDGDVEIDGGTISVSGSDATAVSALGSVTVKSGSVTSSGSDGTAISSGGNTSVSGGYVSADGLGGQAIEAGGTATLDALDGDALIVSAQALSASGGVNRTQGVLIEGTNGSVYGFADLNRDLTIADGVTLNIPSDAYLTNNNRLVINGTLDNSNGGAIENRGTITINGALDNENGVISNYGTIDGTGSVNNTGGEINNEGSGRVTGVTVTGNEPSGGGSSGGDDNNGGGGGGCDSGFGLAALLIASGAAAAMRRKRS